MSPSELHHLSISSPGEDLLILYDHTGVPIARESRRLDLHVAPGLYRVRAQYKEQFEEQVVVVDGPTTVRCDSRPQNFSAAPIASTTAAHFAEAGRKLSTAETRAPLGTGEATSHVMVFVRCAKPETYGGEELLADLQLLNAAGQVLSSFATDETDVDPTGCAGLAAKATPGFYRLRFDGDEPREVPIHVFAGWATHVFVTYSDRPLLEAMTVFLTRIGTAFNANADSLAAVDLGLWALQNGASAFPREQARQLIEAKFDDPLMGLVGAHVMMKRSDFGPQSMAVVLANLAHLLGPDAEDVRALKIRAALEWPASFTIDAVPFRHPPMLRVGLDAVITAAIDVPDLIADDSLIEIVAAGRSCDSAWTTWLPETENLTVEDLAEGLIDLAQQAGKWVMRQLRLSKVVRWQWIREAPAGLYWFDTAIIDALSRGRGEVLTERDLARALRLPRLTVRRRLKALREADDGLRAFVQENWAMELEALLARLRTEENVLTGLSQSANANSDVESDPRAEPLA